VKCTKCKKEIGNTEWSTRPDHTCNECARLTWNCLECGELGEVQFDSCWKCGTLKSAKADPNKMSQALPLPGIKPTRTESYSAVGSSKFEGFRTYTVGGFTYLMEYFEAKFSGSGSVHDVADQFTQFVSQRASKGFEFFRCDEVPYRVTPGCLAGLFGAKESYGHCTIVTFRKKAD